MNLNSSGVIDLLSRCLTRRPVGYVLLAFTLALSGCGWCVTTRGPVLPEHAEAPDFSLVSQNGETISLHGLLEKGPVVLLFYRGHW